MYWWLVKKIAWVPLYSRLMSLISWWVASLSSRCDHCWIESCTKRTRSGIRWWWCPWQTCSCICRRDVALHNTEWMSCLLATCMSIQLPVAQCWLYLLLMISSLWSVDVKIHPLQSYTSIYILLYPHSVSPWQVVHLIYVKQVNGHEMSFSYTKPNPPLQDSHVDLEPCDEQRHWHLNFELLLRWFIEALECFSSGCL